VRSFHISRLFRLLWDFCKFLFDFTKIRRIMNLQSVHFARGKPVEKFTFKPLTVGPRLFV
jgi:hypothetical protein